MKRIIQPEWLDTLPVTDPRAIRSRRDLRRVNTWMRNHVIMAKQLRKNLNGYPPRHFTEIGAGDGNFLYRVSRLIPSHWTNAKITLLDLQPNVMQETLASFAEGGWRVETVVGDVFIRLPDDSDVVIANLFLHHFEETRLRELLCLITQHARLFIALEPRRAAWSLFCSRLLWAIGCNDVTRHDAVVSVRAGFNGQELTALWPERNGWQLTDCGAGPFSHLFIARKTS